MHHLNDTIMARGKRNSRRRSGGKRGRRGRTKQKRYTTIGRGGYRM